MDAEMLKTILAGIATGRNNAAVSRTVGCDRRTVRRYRRLIHALGVPACEVAALDCADLRGVFDVRLPLHEEPDFAALAAEFPGSTARYCYERYRERRLALGQAAMSVSQFNRLRAEHEVRQSCAARFAPPMLKTFAHTLERWPS